MQTHELPRDFCIAVVGHEGWNRHRDAIAPYALCISIEALDQAVPVHAQISLGVNELQVELGVKAHSS